MASNAIPLSFPKKSLYLTLHRGGGFGVAGRKYYSVILTRRGKRTFVFPRNLALTNYGFPVEPWPASLPKNGCGLVKFLRALVVYSSSITDRGWVEGPFGRGYLGKEPLTFENDFAPKDLVLTAEYHNNSLGALKDYFEQASKVSLVSRNCLVATIFQFGRTQHCVVSMQEEVEAATVEIEAIDNAMNNGNGKAKAMLAELVRPANYVATLKSAYAFV